METLIGLIGFTGVIVGIVMLIIAHIKKRKKKTSGIILAVSFVLFIIAVAITPDTEEVNSDKEKVETSATVKESGSNLTVQEYESRIAQAFKEMGSKTEFKIISNEVHEDGKTVITLSDDAMIFIETNTKGFIDNISLEMTPDIYFVNKDDFNFAFLLLVGTADESLSMGERNLLIRELGLDDEDNFKKKYKTDHTNNGIEYKYNGTFKEGFVLQAEYK